MSFIRWIVWAVTLVELIARTVEENLPPEHGNQMNKTVSRLCIGGELDGQRKDVNPLATGMAGNYGTYRLVLVGGVGYFVSEEMSHDEFERYHREILVPCEEVRA